MNKFVIDPPAVPSVGVTGRSQRFPIRRVFCVGRNYAAHAREMGNDPSREPPFFFTKPADAVVPASGQVPYPPLTSDLHHEVEMVVAIGAGGRNISADKALALVWGYGVGVDLTRRVCRLKRKNSAGHGTGPRVLMRPHRAATSRRWRSPDTQRKARSG